jgi:hypothetical protein
MSELQDLRVGCLTSSDPQEAYSSFGTISHNDACDLQKEIGSLSPTQCSTPADNKRIFRPAEICQNAVAFTATLRSRYLANGNKPMN